MDYTPFQDRQSYTDVRYDIKFIHTVTILYIDISHTTVILYIMKSVLYIKLNVIVLVFCFSFMIHANAAFDTATFASSTISISGYNLIVSGQVENLTVNQNSFNVTLSPGSSFTVVSTDKKDFSISDYQGFIKSCNTSNTSLVFIPPKTRSTSIVSIPANCSVFTVPSQVIGLSAVAGNAQSTLSWFVPTSDGGSPITDYIVEYKLQNSSTYSIFTKAASALNNAIVTNLLEGQTYAMRVAAKNAAGIGATSTTVLIYISTSTPVIYTPPSSGGGGSIPFTPIVSTSTIPSTTPIINPIITPIVTPIINPVVTPVKPIPVVSDTLSPISIPLWKGKEGKDVIALHAVLATLSLYVKDNTEPDWYYGIKTQTAVKAFQCQQKIVCSNVSTKAGWGVLGKKTKDILNTVIVAHNLKSPIIITGTPVTLPSQSIATSTLATSSLYIGRLILGARNEEVKKVQQALIDKGFLKAPSNNILGLFGLKTQTAVKAYQCFHKIVCKGSPLTTGWGKVGPSTYTSIMTKGI